MKKGGKILDYCKVIAGQSPEGKAYNTDGIGMEFHQGKKAFGIRILEESGVWTTSVTKVAEAGDILMSVRAPVGPTNITDRKVCIGRGLAAIRCSEKILPSFVLYALKNIETAIIGNDGAVFNSINKKMIEEIPIPIADIAEQRRIVSYLGSSFDLIDKIKENASKSLSEAKALFQSALAEAMEPKEGWEEKTLGEIAEIKGGKRVPKGYKLLTEPTNHKYIRVADFNDFGSINLDNIQYISDEVYNQIKRYTISTKDVYISIAGTIGKSGIIPKELEGANLTENACKLVLDSSTYKYYIYYFTKSSIFVRQIEKLTMVSAQPKLALTRLATVTISLPPFPTQKQIVSRLDSLSSKVRAIEDKYQKMIAECDALKQAMLREVFE